MYCFSLIRKGSIHTTKGKIIPEEEYSDLLTAKEIIDVAKEEVEQIIGEAEHEAVRIKKEAEETGYQEGLERVNEHLLYFEEKLKCLKHDMQKAMLPLILKATKRIIGEELELNPESVVNIVIESIRSVSGSKHVRLYVNKADLDFIEKEKERVKAVFDGLESFRIEERPDVDRGSCIIETERGILNATLENQFRALERAFEAHKKRS